MSTRTDRHNETDYYLDSQQLGRQRIVEPIGWQNDLPEMSRSKNNSGVVNKLTFGLEFVKDGADYLTRAKDLFINPTLTKLIQHPTKLKRVKVYDSIIDITEYKYKDKKVKVKAEENGVLMKLTAFKSKKLDLTSLEALDGTVLPLLQRVDLNNLGQELLLVSQFKLDENNKSLVVDEVVASDAYGNRAVPLKLIGSDDRKVHEPNQLVIARLGNIYNTGATNNMFYADNDREKTLNFDLNINFDYHHVNIPSAFEVRLDLVTYKDGSNYNYKIHDTLASSQVLNSNITYVGQLSKTIYAGESLALAVHVYSDPHDLFLEFNTADFSFTENSTYPPSINKMILPLERIERLAQMITGRTDDNLVYSEIFGRIDRGYAKDGELAYSLCGASGFWARGFDEKGFITSWKDTFDSFYPTKAISYNVEKIDGIETIVVDYLKYFYQNGKVFDFPLQAKEEDGEFYKKIQYNIIKVGYNKGGEGYEHSQGLNDPNGKHEYSTPFEGRENLLDLISRDRGDFTGFELIRRFPQLLFPTTDRNEDNDNWLLDCVKIDGNFLIKDWTYTYATQPTGIFSPDTVGNLGLTPARNLKNHSWWINGGLSRFASKDIKFTSGIGNLELSTKLAGNTDLKENANIPINTFDPPRFGDDLIKFDHKIDYKLKELLEGYTEVNGRKVPNFYFIWRVKREDGTIVKLRLLKVEPKSDGKVTALIIK